MVRNRAKFTAIVKDLKNWKKKYSLTMKNTRMRMQSKQTKRDMI